MGEAITRQGWVLIEQGRTKEAIDRIDEGIERSTIKLNEFFAKGLLALAIRRNQQTGRALQLLQQTMQQRESVAPTRLAWLYQLKGELLLLQGSETEAEEWFRQAIATAQAQRARAAELTATTSLARLLRDTGRRDEACKMLTEIYNWFTEGFDTADLKQAKALLDELSADRAALAPGNCKI